MFHNICFSRLHCNWVDVQLKTEKILRNELAVITVYAVYILVQMTKMNMIRKNRLGFRVTVYSLLIGIGNSS
jgi:hypothetical protein